MDGPELDPQLAWAGSGAMALSGPAEGAPRLAPGPIAGFARRELARLAEIAASGALAGLDGAALLGERAAVAGLRRRGRIAPGGSCRLVRAADGWLAINLARPDDASLLPAWLEGDPADFGADAWPEVEARCAERSGEELVARARLLGMPVAHAAARGAAPRPPHRVAARGPEREAATRPLVVDLSALWAGPLCAHLLGLAGADVVKVESRSRPDGARRGPRTFFDLVNAGKRCVAVDLAQREDREALRHLLARADIVVESARPRALRQLGIDAEAWVAERAGLVWVSITGYGRREPGSEWVAFGDDAACAAGLAAGCGEPDAPLFCGDAIADPLAGIHAAGAAWQAHLAGGSVLLDVALCDVAAHAAAGPVGEARVRRRGDGWVVESAGGCAAVAAPRARALRSAARPLGADTREVLC